MTTIHLLTDPVTGRVMSTQDLADNYAPILMGSQTAVALQAARVTSGTISGTGGTAGAAILGDVLFAISGTFTGAVQLERSFDGGTTYVPARDELGGLVQLALPGEIKVSETEGGVLYRLNCTALSAGTIAWQVGR